MKPDICIYHGNCADGFGAAYAVWRRWGTSVEFVPGVYGQDPPAVTGKRVLMVDFSYKRPVLEAMGKVAKDITILDHHKTAQADLETFAIFNPVQADDIDLILPSTQPGLGNIRAEFDMERSGAVMTWQFCHRGAPVPKMLLYVQDRDLWRFALPHSREVAAWVFSHPYRFVTWEEMARQVDSPDYFQGVVDQGAAIERKHHKDIAELLPITTREMVIGGTKVPVANLPYTMASDAAGKLAQTAPFGACYYDGPKLRVFSLRSRGDGVDVSEIAKHYGGGGHKNAAGFQKPLGWEGDEPA